MGIVAEAADEVESQCTDAFIEGAGREEGVGNDKAGQFEKFLAIALDNRYVVVHQRHVALIEFKVV